MVHKYKVVQNLIHQWLWLHFFVVWALAILVGLTFLRLMNIYIEKLFNTNLAALLWTISSLETLCLADGDHTGVFKNRSYHWHNNMFPWLHLLWLIVINFCRDIRIAQKAGLANMLPKTTEFELYLGVNFADRLPVCSALVEDKETLTYFCDQSFTNNQRQTVRTALRCFLF